MRENFFKRDNKKNDLHQKLIPNEYAMDRSSGARRLDRDVSLSTTNSSANNKLPSTIAATASNNVVTISPSVESNQNNTLKNSQWDFCIVIPNPEFIEKGETEPRKVNLHYREIIERLLIGGLDIYQFYSGDGDEIFIKVGASIERLEKWARKSILKFLLDPHYLKEKLDTLHPIHHDPSISPISPYQFIYHKYIQEKADMFAKGSGLNHPFSSIIRIKLIYEIILSNDDDCCGLNMRNLLKDSKGMANYNNSILACFPLHDLISRDRLWREWSNWRSNPWDQPIEEIRSYLGEKVALYFEFNGHLSKWLLPLSVVGIFVTISWIIEFAYFNNVETAFSSAYATPFYCVFVSFWSQFMIEYWKRSQNQIAMECGMSDFEEVQKERPEHQGANMKSPIDGSDIKFTNPSEIFRRQLYSFFVISLAMIVVIACVSLIFYLQYVVRTKTPESSQSYAGLGVSILSAVQIIVLGYYYNDLAIYLNDNENHRTDTEYEDSLIGKIFVFSFVNSYASLFFVAFIQSNIGESCVGSCFSQLSYQLTTIIASKVTVEKISVYLTLVVEHEAKEYEVKKEYEERKKVLDKEVAEGKRDKANAIIPPRSTAELESEFQYYDESLGVLQDYGKIFIQFGFITLFVAACPLAPALAYISTWIQLKTDAWKLLYMTKRVIPTGAQDIGTWETILQITAVISVITNAGILCFTMDVLHTGGTASIWIFVSFQYFIFFSMGIFAYFVDDVPKEVEMQLLRQDHLRNLIDGIDDTKHEEAVKSMLNHFPSDVFHVNSEDFTEKKK
mmetsp:Transcript_32767/g.47312  ORF Transcript_32767/g.47312 Transcript_32767/m.47312 type:complete len:789 (-) Transcript_32767:186-2552(-)